MPTLDNVAAVLAAIQLDTDPRPGVSSPLDWYRVADQWVAVPSDGASYEWQSDLWWSGEAGGRLLAALHRADSRALTQY